MSNGIKRTRRISICPPCHGFAAHSNGSDRDIHSLHGHIDDVLPQGRVIEHDDAKLLRSHSVLTGFTALAPLLAGQLHCDYPLHHQPVRAHCIIGIARSSMPHCDPRMLAPPRPPPHPPLPPRPPAPPRPPYLTAIAVSAAGTIAAVAATAAVAPVHPVRYKVELFTDIVELRSTTPTQGAPALPPDPPPPGRPRRLVHHFRQSDRYMTVATATAAAAATAATALPLLPLTSG